MSIENEAGHVSTVSPLERAVCRSPSGDSPRALRLFAATLSRDLIAAQQPVDEEGAVKLVQRKAASLGLDPKLMKRHLLEALRQHDSLGPDERAEYERNLGRVLRSIECGQPDRPTPEELFRVFLLLGRDLSEVLGPDKLSPDQGCALFLGTDGEFPTIVHNLLARRADAAEIFYISRLSLLSSEERQVLSVTQQEVLGSSRMVRRRGRDGSPGRFYTWTDNGLVASVVMELVEEVRGSLTPGGPPFPDVFLARFRQELRARSLQIRRIDRGSLTAFGKPHPEIDRVLARGVTEGRFAAVVSTLRRRLVGGPLRGGRQVTIVDLGATGTQPCLLFGATDGNLRVRLFAPDPAVWGNQTDRFQVAPASANLALGIESVKTFKTLLKGDTREKRLVAVVPPAQQVLAALKLLAFHRAALEQRR